MSAKLEAIAKLIEALSHLLGVTAWPAVSIFFVFRFGASIRDFIVNISEGSFKGFGVEATAKRRSEAVAAIVAAQAKSDISEAGASTRELKDLTESFVSSEKIITQSAIRSSDNKSILWVDDSPSNNIYERKAFRALGFRVWSVRSTEEALRVIGDENKFDVIISDMSRPEGIFAGYDLLSSLRKIGCDVPFVIYSSSNTHEQAAMARQRGAFGSTTDAGRLAELVLDAVKYRSTFR